MEKPTLKVPYPPMLDWHEIEEYIKHLTGRDVRDWMGLHGPTGHFDQWCDAQGYGEKDKDPQGQLRGHSQFWYAEYETDPAGKAKAPEYCDMWQWIRKVCQISQGADFYLPVIEEEDDCLIGAPAWVKEICDLIAKEFPEHIEHGAIRMFVDW